MISLENKLERARINLYRSHFFLGSVLMGLKTEIDNSIPTASVNGTTIKFNSKFVDSLTDGQLVFLYAHEIMHVILGHHIRILERDPEYWNIATDIVINELLLEDKVGEWIPSAIRDIKLYKEGNKAADGVYRILMKENGLNVISFDKLEFPENGDDDKSISAEDIQRVKDDLDKLITQALAVTGMASKDSGNVVRYVKESLYIKPDCLKVLVNYLDKVKDSNRTYSRPNRRFISQGLYLPSKDEVETVGKIAVAIDCSGSITDRELAYFKGMLETLKDMFNPTELKVIYFDYQVSKTEVFGKDDPIRLAFYGGGGTSYTYIWEHISSDYKVCLVFTDLDCKSFGKEPEIPIVWVSTDTFVQPPFGRVVSFYNQF